MFKTERNNFVSKINEMHHIITVNKNPIDKNMCHTMMSQLSSQDCVNFFNDPDDIKTNDICKIKKKLLECTNVSMPNTQEHNTLVIMINKVCGTNMYNNNVINEINTNFESLLTLISIDQKLISLVKSQDDKFYIKLINFLKSQDVLKVFKNMPEHIKTIAVCKCALQRDYNCIKYMNHVLDDNMCEIAIALGHTNLSDIPAKFHTETIYKKYIDANNENIKYIKYVLPNSKLLSNSFLINLVAKDINNISLFTDQLCFTVDLCTYIVNKNGLLIKNLPVEKQTMRLLELAITQNKLAKYYVTYNCFPNANLNDIQLKIVNAFVNIKKIKESIDKQNFIDLCFSLCKTDLSLKSGILIKKQIPNNNFYVMTAENYLNHQYRLYVEEGYNPNIDVIDLKFFHNLKTSSKTDKTINELSASFTDSYKNSYVVLFEFI